MPTEIKMPALSPTMEKGTLARWLVAPGDTIRAGDLIAEIETDKATMEMEADEDGRISQLVVSEGSADVAVGTVIAVLAADGEEIAAAAPKPEARAEPAPKAAAPESAPSPAAAPTPAPAPSAAASAPPALDKSANATPLARRIAALRGVSLDTISGSGSHGRVVVADLGVEIARPAVAAAATIVASAAPVAIAPPPEGVPVRTSTLSTMRRTIARRLTESKQTVPHFYLTARCSLDALLALRADLNATLASTGVKLSVNDLLVKAMARALEQVPDANVQFGGEEIHHFQRVDIAMAVAIDGGLITPVIRDAGGLSLSAIARESKNLAQKAREGRLTPADYQGGTATISNLGMFGIDEMFPVINPPQALILGIGAGIEQPWKVNGQLGLATIMAATGSFDHRAIDGAVAAQFMKVFREIVETPMLLVA